jgi:hypothetical protein
MTFDQTQSPSDEEFPCILLSYQTSVYAAFAPLPLLNGSTSNPKDVFFGKDFSLFDGPIDDFIYAVKQSLNIPNDVVLEFQDMQLQLHSDSYMTNSLSLSGIHKVYTDMRIGQNYLGKIPPLKIKIMAMISCFSIQLDRLKEANQEALAKKSNNPYIDKGDCENPISIDDDPKFTNDEVIVIDDDDDLDVGKKVKITRPFKRNKKSKRIVQKDLRGSSSILRFTRFK